MIHTDFIHRPAAIMAAAASPPIIFSRPFAPSEGHVAAPEKPYRAEMCLNGTWRFEPEALPAGFRRDAGDPPDLPPPAADGWDPTPIKIPSPWNVNAFNQGDGGDFRCYPSYPTSWNDAQMGWLQRTFIVPSTWKGKRLLLRFDAIAGNSDIYINGHKVGSNFDLFLPATFDITDDVHPGGPNDLLVGVRKASLFNLKGVSGARPYPGGSMWGQSIVGIWQDVFLDALPAVHVEDDYITPEVSKGVLGDQVTVRNDGQAAETVRVGGEVCPWVNLAGPSTLDAPEPNWRLGKPVLSLPSQAVTVPAGQSATVDLQAKAVELKTWSPDAPNLYGMVVSVSRGSIVLDRHYTRFGWREFTFRGNRQYLNGKPLELRGDSWHFLGIPQMTRRYAWAWFKALKQAHGNAVRLHAQPYPAFYLDVADEMGVCVLDETAIWGSDAGHAYDNPDFWTRAGDHVRRLILRDRNHASVFGWSLSNECAWYVDHKQPDLLDRLKQGWRDWLSTARALDPTRPWVSTDGDGDAYGIMPTYVGHYANPKDIVRPDKPYGEGETGGAYYATPRQAARFGGDRAYESQQGRMEGIAREAYGLISGQRAVGASYVSVFNLVWYGLQPLEIGLPDTTRPPTLRDGIFFPAYRQGVPGVQPERLGPYCTTLNAGYDPSLPLDRTWPLADAIEAAYAPGGPRPSPWDHLIQPPASSEAPAVPPSIDSVVVLADAHSLLPNELTSLGVTVAGPEALDTAGFIVIDGASPPQNAEHDLWPRVASRVHQGAVCLVLGIDGGSVDSLQSLLPAPVQVTDRTASSLLIRSTDPLVAGLTDGDFYYSESESRPAVSHCLTGPLVDAGEVILTACPTDWRRWNDRPEPVKTASTLRSEREAQPGGAALVSVRDGAGRYLASTIDLMDAPMGVDQMLARMIQNAGVRLISRHEDSQDAFDGLGRLTRALVCGRFSGTDPAKLYDTDHIGIDTALRPAPGTISGGLPWTPMTVTSTGSFDFVKSRLPGPTENAAVYLCFWIWSPRPLDNLLAEPNMPRLDLTMGSDDGCQVWLNSNLIKEDRGTHPLTPDSITAESLPLTKGWNQFVVKVVQGGGQWAYEARLRSSDPRFLLELRSSIAHRILAGN